MYQIIEKYHHVFYVPNDLDYESPHKGSTKDFDYLRSISDFIIAGEDVLVKFKYGVQELINAAIFLKSKEPLEEGDDEDFRGDLNALLGHIDEDDDSDEEEVSHKRSMAKSKPAIKGKNDVVEPKEDDKLDSKISKGLSLEETSRPIRFVLLEQTNASVKNITLSADKKYRLYSSLGKLLSLINFEPKLLGVEGANQWFLEELEEAVFFESNGKAVYSNHPKLSRFNGAYLLPVCTKATATLKIHLNLDEADDEIRWLGLDNILSNVSCLAEEFAKKLSPYKSGCSISYELDEVKEI